MGGGGRHFKVPLTVAGKVVLKTMSTATVLKRQRTVELLTLRSMANAQFNPTSCQCQTRAT